MATLVDDGIGESLGLLKKIGEQGTISREQLEVSSGMNTETLGQYLDTLCIAGLLNLNSDPNQVGLSPAGQSVYNQMK